MSGASDQAKGQASGPALTSRFWAVLPHCAVVRFIRDGAWDGAGMGGSVSVVDVVVVAVAAAAAAVVSGLKEVAGGGTDGR